MFFNNLSKFLFLIIFFILILNCREKKTKIKSTSDSLIKDTLTFKDEDSLIELELNQGYEFNKFSKENEKYYIFEWYQNTEQGKKLLHKLELRIFSEKSVYYGQVIQPNYEIGFLKFCNCTIFQRGWIFIKNTNAREYHYKTGNFTAISLHFNQKNFLIQLEAVSENDDLLVKFWQKIIKEIR